MAFCVHDLLHRRIGGPSRKLIVVSYKSLPDNVIAAIEEDDFEKFMTNDSKIQDFGRRMQVHAEEYHPKSLEFVIGFNEKTQRWYRCAFLEDKENGCALLYKIDWGSCFVTSKKNIRVSKNCIIIYILIKSTSTSELIYIFLKLF